MLKSSQLFSFIILVMVSLLAVGMSSASTQWPGDDGVEIGREGEWGGLPDGFEPSGAVWHPVRKTLILVDDSGLVVELDPDIGVVSLWEMDEDLEGVTIADPESGLVYLAIEDPDAVLEFSLSTGTATGNSWDLTPWLTGPDNHGLEALAWVDGLFYAGLQEDGNIFMFTLTPGTTAQYQGMIAPHEGRDDISGLHYDSCTGTLYAIHDSHDVIVEMNAAGSFLREYELVGQKQEGVAVVGRGTTGQTTVFIAQDSGEVWMYGEYEIDPCQQVSAVAEVFADPLLLLECIPNPFNPMTELSFELEHSAHVSLQIYNIAGQCLCTLVNDTCGIGGHSFIWQGRDDAGQILASGIYFARLDVGGIVQTSKLVMSK